MSNKKYKNVIAALILLCLAIAFTGIYSVRKIETINNENSAKLEIALEANTTMHFKIDELESEIENLKREQLKTGYVKSDLQVIKEYIMDEISLNQDQLSFYDVNKDGVVNSADYVIIKKKFGRDILITAYHTGDGSSDVTASGLNTNQFQINENGWYTYEGKVVLATANQNRMSKPMFTDYKSHDLYESINFELDGTNYQGVVLDVCGACYGVDGETEQRYDIFTNGVGIGKQQGFIYEEGK